MPTALAQSSNAVSLFLQEKNNLNLYINIESVQEADFFSAEFFRFEYICNRINLGGSLTLVKKTFP